MITISVCMIVKNEESTLERCLTSLKGIADEIIIVDTGSTDLTKQTARKFTDKVFDFMWNDNFADARNFSFSKATMEYIYSADADEMLTEENRRKFLQLKSILLPEIDIVQMLYTNTKYYRTTENFEKEYRPKLFKRLRSFQWMDAIHEIVNVDPVIYDSEIEILHMPVRDHAKRDLSCFANAIAKGHQISVRLHNMYARELMISGKDEDFIIAKNFFLHSYLDCNRSKKEKEEAACILARAYRIEKEYDKFLEICLNAVSDAPSSEICVEVGEYYLGQQNYAVANKWFRYATKETQAILNIASNTDIPLEKMEYCNAILQKTGECNPVKSGA